MKLWEESQHMPTCILGNSLTQKEQLLCMNMVAPHHMLKDPESSEPISVVSLKLRSTLFHFSLT